MAADDNPYSETPFAESYSARHAAWFNFELKHPNDGVYSQAVLLASGQHPDEAALTRSLEFIDSRHDCADFRLADILRILHQFRTSPLLTDAFRARARETVLKFKYWPNEPGVDSMCSWSENHFILFSSACYLAGHLFPADTFVNSGRTGREQMDVARPRILRWLNLRYHTGFSEWLSNVYYDEDLAALLNLADFCGEEDIRQRAMMVTDLLIADIALNSFHGALASTHGRTYEHQKKWANTENTAGVAMLLFGMNTFHSGGMAAVSLALSPNYRLPRVIYEMAADIARPEMINRQREGLRLEDAPKWGLDFNRLEDGMTFFSLEAYTHPKTVNLTIRMMDRYNFWENEFFKDFKKRKETLETLYRWDLLPVLTRAYKHDLQRNQREEANIYTYRTPDYMLSTAQDYRPGFGGDQQHVWQAALGPRAMCFTTHPARRDGKTPNYWAGSGTLPRAAQIKNVTMIVCKVSSMPGLYVTNELFFTHAWLPKDQFDEFIEKNGWYFARRGDGYLALWSREPCHWQTEEGEDKDRELIAPGDKNVWICELGRRATDGEFPSFVDRIANAHVHCDGLQVIYHSPSQGRLEFGWRGNLRQNENIVEIANYPRYDNPYGEAPFASDKISFNYIGQSLLLDWTTLRREATDYCTNVP